MSKPHTTKGVDFLQTLHTYVSSHASELLPGGSLRLTLTPSCLHYIDRKNQQIITAEAQFNNNNTNNGDSNTGTTGGGGSSSSSDKRRLSNVYSDILHGFHYHRFRRLLSLLRVLTKLRLEGSIPVSMNSSVHLRLLPGLQVLDLVNCRDTMIYGMSSLRPNMHKLTVRTTIDVLSTLLSECFGDHAEPQEWTNLRSLSCQHNELIALDDSLRLLPAVEVLDISHNAVCVLEHTQHCYNLQYLNAGFNHIRDLENVNRVLGNVNTVILRSNRITSVGALAKLYSLEKLDLSDNLISSVDECKALGSLPCLSALWLAGNPIALLDNYRVEMYTIFWSQLANEFTLDNEPPTSNELAEAKELKSSQYYVKKRDSVSIAMGPSSGVTHAAVKSSDIAHKDTKVTVEKTGGKASTSHKRKLRARVADIRDDQGISVAGTDGVGPDASLSLLKHTVAHLPSTTSTDKQPDGDTIASSPTSGGAINADSPSPPPPSNSKANRRNTQAWTEFSKSRLGVSDYSSHIQELAREGGQNWMTILKEYQNSLENEDVSGDASPSNSRQQLSTAVSASVSRIRSSRYSSSSQTPHMRVYLKHLEGALTDESGNEDDELDDVDVDELLSSYECVAWRLPPVTGDSVDTTESLSELRLIERTEIILSLNRYGVKELDVVHGQVILERSMGEIVSAKCVVEASLLKLFFREPLRGGGGGSNEIWEARRYIVEDEDTLMDLFQLCSERIGMVTETTQNSASTTTNAESATTKRAPISTILEDVIEEEKPENEHDISSERVADGETEIVPHSPPPVDDEATKPLSSMDMLIRQASMGLQAQDDTDVVVDDDIDDGARSVAVKAQDSSREKRRPPPPPSPPSHQQIDTRSHGTAVATPSSSVPMTRKPPVSANNEKTTSRQPPPPPPLPSSSFPPSTATPPSKRSSLTMALQEATDMKLLKQNAKGHVDGDDSNSASYMILKKALASDERQPKATRLPISRASTTPNVVVLDDYFPQQQQSVSVANDASDSLGEKRKSFRRIQSERGFDEHPRAAHSVPVSSDDNATTSDRDVLQHYVRTFSEMLVLNKPNTEFLLYAPIHIPASVSSSSRRTVQHRPEKRVYVVLTKTHLLLLDMRPHNKQLQPSCNVEFAAPYESIQAVTIGFFLQYLHVFSADDNVLLLAREKELTHRIIVCLTQAVHAVGGKLNVESDDSQSIQRIQTEALGGETDNVCLYALVFKVDEDTGNEIPVSLVVTDRTLVCCIEDFLETSGTSSRYVGIALESLEDLSRIVVKSPPHDERSGRMSLFFGQRNVFRGEFRHRSREWEITSFSASTMHLIQKCLNKYVSLNAGTPSMPSDSPWK